MRKLGVFRFLFGDLSMTFRLIAINVAIFVIALIINAFHPGFFDLLVLVPSDFIQGKNLWTLVTSMFMHAGFMHLFFNMFSLWFVGSFIERLIGRKRFLAFYIISGIIAGLFYALLSGFFGFGILERVFGNPSIGGVGASGALFGLVGLLAVIVPKSKVYLIAGPLVAIVIESILGVFAGSSGIYSVVSTLVSIYILVSIFSIVSMNPRTRKIALPVEMPFWFLPIVAIVPLVIVSFFVDLPIGNMAHFGGLIVGLVYGFYLRHRYKKKVQLIGRMFR